MTAKVEIDPLDRALALGRETPAGCWQHRSPDAAGYGRIGIGKRTVYAHRYVFERMVADLPDGLVIDHLCRNRACMNPAHLDVVPQRINILRGDRITKPITACKHGHDYTPENTIFNSKGHRVCRTCTDNRKKATK